MSDKKQPKQSKPDDETTVSNHNVESQTGLSTSIKMSSSPNEPSEESVAADNTKKSSDKDHAKITATENKSQTESLSNTNNEKSTVPVKNTTTSTSSHSPTAKSKTPLEKSPVSKTKKNKISKTAVVALIIALLAMLASVGHYFWIEQQKKQYSQQLNEIVERKLIENQKEIAQQLSQNLKIITQNVSQQFSQSQQANAAKINALNNKIARAMSTESSNAETIAQVQQKIVSLGQNQPSDWLLQEAEYLIRVASRSLWLEKETRTAISLLNDADLRIQELNDPQFLALRQTIQQDIAKLQQLPKLATDDVILKLMVLEQQIKQLPMALFEIPEMNQTQSSLELTDNATDWRENLAKTWRKFIDEFFTVTRRTGNIEPLMSPQFQQNLRENLSLKIQTAIWAASKSNSEIYRQSLSATERWISEYFDMTKLENQSFLSTLDSLKSATVEVVYPNNLDALKAIRQVLSDKQRSLVPALKQENTNDSPQESLAKPESSEQREDA